MFRAAVGPPGHRWWPSALAGADLDYTDSLDVVAADGDTVVSALLAVAPSGTGERQAAGLSISGTTLTAKFTGGVQGRVYRNEITIIGASGRTWQWVICQMVGTEDALPPPPYWVPPPPPSPGFGVPITWASGQAPFVFGAGLLGVSPPLVLTGTNQATALPLPAATNLIVSAPSGTGGILPGNVVGTVFVVNNDPSGNAAIYPPVGWQINALGTNVPFYIGANGGRISFTTTGATSQYWAG